MKKEFWTTSPIYIAIKVDGSLLETTIDTNGYWSSNIYDFINALRYLCKLKEKEHKVNKFFEIVNDNISLFNKLLSEHLKGYIYNLLYANYHSYVEVIYDLYCEHENDTDCDCYAELLTDNIINEIIDGIEIPELKKVNCEILNDFMSKVSEQIVDNINYIIYERPDLTIYNT